MRIFTSTINIAQPNLTLLTWVHQVMAYQVSRVRKASFQNENLQLNFKKSQDLFETMENHSEIFSSHSHSILSY